jgi:hypothetical protein
VRSKRRRDLPSTALALSLSGWVRSGGCRLGGPMTGVALGTRWACRAALCSASLAWLWNCQDACFLLHHHPISSVSSEISDLDVMRILLPAPERALSYVVRRRRHGSRALLFLGHNERYLFLRVCEPFWAPGGLRVRVETNSQTCTPLAHECEPFPMGLRIGPRTTGADATLLD